MGHLDALAYLTPQLYPASIGPTVCLRYSGPRPDRSSRHGVQRAVAIFRSLQNESDAETFFYHAMFVVVVIMMVFVTLLSMTKIKHFCCDLSLHSSTSLGVYSEVQQLLTVLRGLYGLTCTRLVCRLYNADRTRSPPKAVKHNEFEFYSRH